MAFLEYNPYDRSSIWHCGDCGDIIWRVSARRLLAVGIRTSKSQIKARENTFLYKNAQKILGNI